MTLKDCILRNFLKLNSLITNYSYVCAECEPPNRTFSCIWQYRVRRKILGLSDRYFLDEKQDNVFGQMCFHTVNTGTPIF